MNDRLSLAHYLKQLVKSLGISKLSITKQSIALLEDKVALLIKKSIQNVEQYVNQHPNLLIDQYSMAHTLGFYLEECPIIRNSVNQKIFLASQYYLSKRYGNRSKRANILFPISRIEKLAKKCTSLKITDLASLYLTCYLEYVVTEIVRETASVCREMDTLRIKPKHLYVSIYSNIELTSLFNSYQIVIEHNFDKVETLEIEETINRKKYLKILKELYISREAIKLHQEREKILNEQLRVIETRI